MLLFSICEDFFQEFCPYMYRQTYIHSSLMDVFTFSPLLSVYNRHDARQVERATGG